MHVFVSEFITECEWGESRSRAEVSKQTMIPFLARLFRRLHWVVGVSAPPPGTNDRRFVLMWLGIIAAVALWSAFVLYLVVYVF